MSLASDEDVRTAAPVIEPLLQLAGSASLSWATTSTRDGYTVSEIPAAPTLGIPIKCFRTQFVVHADVDTLAQVVLSEAALRQCDPTLAEMRVLGQDRCNTLVYTAYTSPSPWLVSPRDFCVTAASIVTTPEQLNRVCPQTPPTIFSEYLRDASDAPLREGCPPPASSVFVQNSRSTTSPLCPPLTAADGSTAYIRGVVHCYGYIAWPDVRQKEKLHVSNFCCVDACGRIPKWLMAAAADQNMQKLKRLAQLAEEATRDRKANAFASADAL
jgi:hypothetical protein